MKWFQLARIALLPTIAWDFTVGILLANQSLSDWPVLAFVALAFIYHGSMILNDVADLQIDIKAHRPRPIVRKEINRVVALCVGLLMYALAAAICYIYYHKVFDMCMYLICTVLLYNFSPTVLRKYLGPTLLATARAFSLMFGVSALIGPAHALNDIAYANIMCYALYYLFISRMAQYEEQGMPAMRGLAFVGMACLSPTLLLASELHNPLLIVALLAFTVIAARRPWQNRKQFWDQQTVQMQTRSSLCMAPLVLGLCLLASAHSGNHLLALCSLGVVVVTINLAKRFAPE
jgi:4-hydroxybenzoate polyprenyltransferase